MLTRIEFKARLDMVKASNREVTSLKVGKFRETEDVIMLHRSGVIDPATPGHVYTSCSKHGNYSEGLNQAESAELAEAIAANTTLKSISIRGCDINSELTTGICQIIARNTELYSLNLTDIKISLENFERICVAVSSTETLLSLKIKCKEAAHSFKKENYTALSNMLAACCLSDFALIGFEFEDDACLTLCEGLAENKSLNSIDFTDSYIKDSGASELARIATKHPQLTKINLALSAFNADGAEAFCKAAEENKNLTEIIFFEPDTYDNYEDRHEYLTAGYAMLEAIQENRRLSNGQKAAYNQTALSFVLCMRESILPIELQCYILSCIKSSIPGKNLEDCLNPYSVFQLDRTYNNYPNDTQHWREIYFASSNPSFSEVYQELINAKVLLQERHFFPYDSIPKLQRIFRSIDGNETRLPDAVLRSGVTSALHLANNHNDKSSVDYYFRLADQMNAELARREESDIDSSVGEKHLLDDAESTEKRKSVRR